MLPRPATRAHARSNAPARVGYLGPRGTFSEQALLGSTEPGAVAPIPLATIHDAVLAVAQRRVRWSLVPIENSIEGPVTATLDALTGTASAVRIVGELVLGVRQCLIVCQPLALSDIDTVVSHPQASGQCARFLRERLPEARILPASSTAEAVRTVAESPHERWAALGPRLAAELYGAHVLHEGVEDLDGNETRFVWLGHVGEPPGARPPSRRPADHARRGAVKTSLVFWGLGAQRPGWLVACLGEFAARAVNLTKIESRPQRDRLGRYMFFVDVEGDDQDRAVADALTALRGHCEEVRVLGSYPVEA